MEIVFWAVVLFGCGYSFWYVYYLLRAKNKLGAVGMAFVGLLIGVLSFMVKLK